MAEEKKDNNSPHDNKDKESKNPFSSLTGSGDGKKPKFNFYWVYGILAVIFIGIQLLSWDTGAKKTGWGELKEMLERGDVERVVLVNKETAEIFIKAELLTDERYRDVKGESAFNKGNPHYYYNVGSTDKFIEQVDEAQKNATDPIYIENEVRHNWGGEIISWIFPILLLVGLWFFFMRMMN